MFIHHQLQYGTPGCQPVRDRLALSRSSGAGVWVPLPSRAQHRCGSAPPALLLPYVNNITHTAKRCNFPQSAAHESKSPDSTERRRSPRQRCPTAALHPALRGAPCTRGHHRLLPLSCGQRDVFSHVTYPIGPPVLKAKIGGVVSAHRRKFWVIKGSSCIPLCTL